MQFKHDFQDFGFLPRRRPLRVVVGAPLEVRSVEGTTPNTSHLTQVTKVESPSREQVEQVHQQVGHSTLLPD